MPPTSDVRSREEGRNGVKLTKTVTQGVQVATTHYMDGYQYLGGKLDFFPTSEGSVEVTYDSAPNGGNNAQFNYVYHYLDHLGNIRLRYAKDPRDGELKILEEKHYYPFGLTHSGYNNTKRKFTKTAAGSITHTPVNPFLGDGFKYGFNGKEEQNELGLNYLDFGARNYDAALGRWMNVDPLAESFPGWSPYTYVYNNPLNYTDSTGMCPDGDCPEETYIGKTNELPEVVITAKGRSKDRGWTSESLTDYNNTQEQYQKDYPEFAGMSDGEMVDHHEQKYGKEYRAWDRKVQGEYRLGQFVNRLKLALDDTGILDYSKVYLEFATGGEAAPVLGRTVSSSIPRIKSGASLFNSYYDDAAIALHHYGNAGFNSFKRSTMRGLSTPLNRSNLGFSGQRKLMNYGARPINYFKGIYKYNHDVMNKGTLDTFMEMRDLYKYGSKFFK